MSARSELLRLRKLAAKRAEARTNTPTAYAAEVERQRAERQAWRDRFVVGGLKAAGPMPPNPSCDGDDFYVKMMQGSAIVEARMRGAIGPLDYLPDASPAACHFADCQCAIAWSIDRSEIARGLAPDEPHPFPEWGELERRIYRKEPEYEDVTKLSDEELEARLKTARERLEQLGEAD